MLAKRCSKCHTLKSLDEYDKHLSTKDGKQSWCSKCVINLNNVKQKEDREKTVKKVSDVITASSKYCKKCFEELDKTHFYINSRYSDGLSTYCKKCTKTANLSRYHGSRQ